MSGNTLKLVSRDGASQIEGRFGGHRVLFLESRSDRLALSEEPGGGCITYAVFVERRGRISALLLRDSSFVGKGCRAADVKSGDELVVGVARYSISARPARTSKIVPALACAVAMAALFTGISYYRAVVGPPYEKQQATATAGGVADGNMSVDTSSLVKEARRHLKAGDMVQARLSLLEALEASPGDEEAQTLLAEIDEGDRTEIAQGARPQAQDAGQGDGNDDALVAFREGQRSKEAGDLSGARTAFDRAARIIQAQVVKPPFAGALESARDELAESLRHELAPRIAQIAGKLDSIAEQDARAAIDRLAQTSKEIEGIISSMPQDAQALAVESRIDSMIKSTAGRWMAGAAEAERLRGCARALPIYREISQKLGELDPGSAAQAREGERRCTM